MTMRCEKVRELLDGFYDGELRGGRQQAVSEHLDACENCSRELKKLESMGQMLKSHYKGLAESESLAGVWNRVDAEIAASPALEPLSLWERLTRVFAIPKPSWAAVGVVALVIVFAISYLPGERGPTLAANECIIESVDVHAEDCSVMVYEVGDSKMKVIWVMEQQAADTGENAGVAS